MNGPEIARDGTRIYRMKSGQRAVGVVILIGSLFFLVAIWGGVLMGLREPSFFEMMSPVGISLFAAFFTLRAYRNAVCLSDNAIERRGFVSTDVLPFIKIEGRRRYLSPGDHDSPDVWHLVLEPNDDRYPRLDIEELYRFDDFFYQWFNALPNLDELDKQRPKASNFGLV